MQILLTRDRAQSIQTLYILEDILLTAGAADGISNYSALVSSVIHRRAKAWCMSLLIVSCNLKHSLALQVTSSLSQGFT